MRLQIGNGGNWLELGSNTSVQLDMTSPLYFADNRGNVLPSVKTYTIAVPNTAANRLQLGRPAELDNPAPFLQESGWYIKYDGYVLLEGRIEVEDGVKEGNINFTFIGGLAGNLNELKTTNLRDLAIDAISLGETDAQVLETLAMMAADTESDYVLPQIRVDATGDRQDETEDDTDNPLPTKYTFLNYYDNGSYLLEGNDRVYPANQFSDGTRPFRATVAPQPLLRPVLEILMERVQYALAGVFDSHSLREDLNQLVLFSNYTLDEQASIPSAGDDVSFEHLRLAENYHPARSLPNVSGADLIRAMVNLFCLAPVLDTQGRRLVLVACQDLLDRAAKKNWTSKVFPQYQRGRKLVEVPSRFAYSPPDENYRDEVVRTIRLSEVDAFFETVAEAEATYTIADVDKLVYIASLNEYFHTRYASFGIGDGLFLFPMGKDLGIIGESSTTPYAPSSSTLHTVTYTYVEGQHIGWRVTNGLLPIHGDVNGGGVRLSTAYYGDLQSPMQEGEPLDDIILLLNRGLITDRDGEQVPHAGAGIYNYYEELMGGMSLLWRGEKGLYEKWWRRWIEALEAMRPVSYPTRLTAADLANLDWREKVIIDKHAYFLKRVQVTLTPNEINTAAVEYMQIN